MFIDVKMLFAGVVHISNVTSLIIILFVLTVAIGTSMVMNRRASGLSCK